MTQSSGKDAPWWESELAIIRDELSLYVRARLRAWPSEHDDLINDTFLALTRELRNRPSAFPASWFERRIPTSETERSYLHKLATVILRRRIADVFRKRASAPDHGHHEQATNEIPDRRSPDPERAILLARLVATTAKILGEMAPEDRDLISLVAGEANLRDALTARERQRLHRIRERLRRELLRRTGNDFTGLLKTR